MTGTDDGKTLIMTHHHDILRLHLEILTELTNTLGKYTIIVLVLILLEELFDRLHVHFRAALVARGEMVLERALHTQANLLFLWVHVQRNHTCSNHPHERTQSVHTL